MPRFKKAIKDQIFDLKNKLNKAKLDKRKLLGAHDDKDNFLLYHFSKYNENKHPSNKK